MSEYFPTKFAMKVAVGSGLCPEKTDVAMFHEDMDEIFFNIREQEEKIEEMKEEMEDSEYTDEIMEANLNRMEKKYKRKAKMAERYEALVEFQNLSIATDFESAMIAYDGIKITEDQKKSLEKIHESTFDWVKGKLVDKMITKIEKTESAREIKELTDALLTVMNGGSEGGSMDMKKIVSYVVNTQ